MKKEKNQLKLYKKFFIIFIFIKSIKAIKL